jgi:hypothetical protein
MKFKHEKDKELILLLNPIMISLLYGVVIPIIKRDYPDYEITITRTVDEKIKGVSVSNSHAEGRAVDIRIFDMEGDQAKKITTDLNLNLSDQFGAISLSDGKRRFAILESSHLHLQIGNLPEDTILKIVNYSIFAKYGIM